jgi:hypothetical protein
MTTYITGRSAMPRPCTRMPCHGWAGRDLRRRSLGPIGGRRPHPGRGRGRVGSGRNEDPR